MLRPFAGGMAPPKATKAAAEEQQALKVQWSLDRLADGGEGTQAENAAFLASIPSSQATAVAMREQGVVAVLLALLKARRWDGPASDVPRQLALTLGNILKQDEAACGQARSSGGGAVLGSLLADTAAAVAAEDSLWDAGHAEAAALEILKALILLVEVDMECQMAACKAGAVGAALQLLSSSTAVRRKATELLRELLLAVAAAPDRSVYDAFADALPAAFPQLHNMLADHTRTFGTVLRTEEALISDILSEVVAHPACSEAKLAELQPHLMAMIAVFVHCSNSRGRRFTPEIEQALANALLAIAAREKLAAGIRRDQPQFELLRSFQAALSSPLAAAAVKQSLAQLQSFVSDL
mmetsp:Transcript_17655/g.53084  ORF Transcript_17655/g.53084 Transcript_17655/m.53084 type:complete len:354 (-) Transcript_17655:1527-2588(-)